MISKAEKRAAKKELKLEKALEKSTRQFAEPTATRAVIEQATVTARKQVSEPTLVTPHQKYMRWDKVNHDKESGQWSWGAERKCPDNDWISRVHPYLLLFEKKKWGEIDAEMTGKGRKRRKKHIYYAIHNLVSEAYDRLIELELDDFAEDIFRFRMSGKERLYGFRVEPTAMFHMIWYDPHHKIYPA